MMLDILTRVVKEDSSLLSLFGVLLLIQDIKLTLLQYLLQVQILTITTMIFILAFVIPLYSPHSLKGGSVVDNTDTLR